MSEYHACASANKCKGLGEGIKGYHKCAKKQNCKKDDRAKVAAVVAKIKTSKAKATLTKVVKKKVEVIRKPKPAPKPAAKKDDAVSFMKKQKARMEVERRAKRQKEAEEFVKQFINKLTKKKLSNDEINNEIKSKLKELKKNKSQNIYKINEFEKVNN